MFCDLSRKDTETKLAEVAKGKDGVYVPSSWLLLHVYGTRVHETALVLRHLSTLSYDVLIHRVNSCGQVSSENINQSVRRCRCLVLLWWCNPPLSIQARWRLLHQQSREESWSDCRGIDPVMHLAPCGHSSF